MFAMRRRHHRLDIWPGFVDVLATVLMVIIFVLMTFVVSQLYLSDALDDRDQSLNLMNQEITRLTHSLTIERLSKQDAEKAMSELQTRLALLTHELQEKHDELATVKSSKEQETTKVMSLSQQITDLQAAIHQLNAALKAEEDKYSGQQLELNQLHIRLDDVLGKKIAELQALQKQLDGLQEENLGLKGKNEDLTKKAEIQKEKQDRNLGQFRSDFLAKLVQIVGDRQDIRVVGDRFVFQSEVLFDRGSADLGRAGQEQLLKLAKALKEISDKIPSSINWVLRVDGHTDQLPIATHQFPSNWELSSARAISVVRYLISQGIEAKNLVAAGFGEFQPLEKDTDGKKTEDALAKNRRIEFKLDQR